MSRRGRIQNHSPVKNTGLAKYTGLCVEPTQAKEFADTFEKGVTFFESCFLLNQIRLCNAVNFDK